MALGDGMVQRREALNVGGVERTAVPQEERHHGRRPDGGGAMHGILPPLIAYARRCLVLYEEACRVEILLGGDKVQGGLITLGTLDTSYVDVHRTHGTVVVFAMLAA
jgi:hypothetical protein